MINRVVLTGRLTSDPEVKQTNGGNSLCRVSLAVSRQFRNKQTGERETDFFSLILWRKQAENFAQFTHKGSLVGIDGELRNNNYTNQNGQEVRSVEVNVNSFSLLESRKQDQGGYQGQYQQQPQQYQQPQYQPQQPQGQQYPQQAPQGQQPAPQYNQPVPQQSAPQGAPQEPQQASKPGSEQLDLADAEIDVDDLPF